MNNAQLILKDITDMVEKSREITTNKEESDYIRYKAKREMYDELVQYLREKRLIK